ncbi:MAG: Rho termination factor N-terminal domain-containing protein [Peptostreptococcaceae bacterium]
MTKDELIKKAKDCGIKGYSKYRKSELEFICSLIEKEYSSYAIEAILDVKKANLDYKCLIEKPYNDNQIQIIKGGLKRGLNVSCILDEEYTLTQMKEILKALESGLDISFVLNKELDNLQIDKIIEALERKIDKSIISTYGKPEIDYFKMRAIFDSFYQNIDLIKYFEIEEVDIFNAPNMHVERTMGFLISKKNKEIIEKFKINENLNEDEKYCMRVICNNKDYVDKFLSMDSSQRREIYCSTFKGRPNILQFVDNSFNDYKIREISIGLLDNVDVLKYNDNSFDQYQMKAIRTGLIEKVNVNIYLDKDISSKAMLKISRSLEDKTFRRNDYFDFNYKKNKYEIKEEFKHIEFKR